MASSVSLNASVDFRRDYEDIMTSSELVTKEVTDIFTECLTPELPPEKIESLKGRIQQIRDSIEAVRSLIKETMFAFGNERSFSVKDLQFAAFASLSLNVDEMNRSRLDTAEKYINLFQPKSK